MCGTELSHLELVYIHELPVRAQYAATTRYICPQLLHRLCAVVCGGGGSPGVGELLLRDWALERAGADGEFQMKLPRKRRRRSKRIFSHVFPPGPLLGAGWYTCLGHLTPPLGN